MDFLELWDESFDLFIEIRLVDGQRRIVKFQNPQLPAMPETAKLVSGGDWIGAQVQVAQFTEKGQLSRDADHIFTSDQSSQIWHPEDTVQTS